MTVSKSIRTQKVKPDVEPISKSKNLGAIYSSFFIVYFTLALFENLFFYYIPLFFYSVINADRVELAYIQFFSYLTLFTRPVSGFIYDRFIQKRIKLTLIVFGSLIPCSVFFFLLNIANLFFYMTFLMIFFASKSVVRGGMSNIFLKYTQTGTDLEQEHIKIAIIRTTSIASTLGGLVVSLIFLFIAAYSFNDWWSFFFIIWLISVPIIIGTSVIQIPSMDNKEKESSTEQPITDTSLYTKIEKKREIQSTFAVKILPMILISLSFFFTLSDAVFEYSFPSWITDNFGDQSFKIIMILHSLLVMCGQVMAGTFTKKFLKSNGVSGAFRRKRFIILGCIIVQASIYVCYTFSPLFVFICFMLLLGFFGALMNTLYADFFADISKIGKHKTLRYQLLTTTWTLASLVLVPLGIVLSISIDIEVLMLLASFLTLLALIPLIFLKNPQATSK